MSKYRIYLVFLLLTAGVIFAAVTLDIWPFALDDAFITFRYSRNFASGNGPVYNPGQLPSEGYTTFLWMTVMVVPHLLKVNALLFAKVAGVLMMLACAVVAFHFVYHVTDFLKDGERYIPAGLAVLMLACYPSTALHTISGMETALFTLLLTWFGYLATRFVDQPDGRSAVPAALVGLLLGLARPEGNLVSLIGLASVLAIIPKPRKGYLTRTILLVYMLPGAVYFLWRAFYYGNLFPLAFYLKVLTSGFMAGRYDVASFGAYLVAHAGVLILLAAHKLSIRLLPALLAVTGFLVFFLFPAHVMGYWWRFLFPTVPFFLVLTALGIAVLLDWMRRLDGMITTSTDAPSDPSQRSLRTMAASGIFDSKGKGGGHSHGQYGYRTLFLLVAGVMVSTGMLVDVQGMVNEGKSYWASLSAAHISLGKRLSRCSSEGSHLLAIGDAGAVPYYSGWRTLDTYGLNDRHIAISNVHDSAYVFSQKPDLLILLSSYENDFYPMLPWELAFYEQGLRAGLSRIEAVKYDSNEYLWVMGDPDNPTVRCLQE